ncbi:alkane 1-monooxygenase [Aeromicrobium chenweiae]|uniref:Alkane 1-monooxygenase n=1 Tax=Aeromicrobium chenweiae TaxID=2079793 RepID=A0A2S0WJ69_9ACTN|nr:alkane 1-monooxygenase [Aeromicrobium chenweiae]AWB91386.1 alkane 1-monooxygenase [Aeromicrobium chenweiae]TGN30683.1 alkane 1-monooxygenase [Aeromicrobium chenweiae]
MTIEATVDGTVIQWRDRKRYLWIIGAIVPLIPVGIWGLFALTGSDLVWFFGPFFVFVVIPVLDLIVGRDSENPPEELLEAIEADRYYRWVTYAFIPVQVAGFIWGAYLLGGGTLPGIDDPLSVAARIGLALSLGMVAGIGINTAHELGHKKEEYERWFARAALAQTFYGHFFIEHNRGHHVRVATPEDPASGRLGETVWEFMPRTVAGSLRSAWELEKKRFARLKTSHWSIKNDVLNAWAFSVVLWGGVMIAFGWEILPYLVLQAIAGIWLLESVNYLEHYGMKRQKLASGRYERVNPSHSWNSNNIGTNVLLYHLQRHSDHHANPTRRYQALRDFKEAPVLPTGYAGMIVLSWVPQIWRSVMDKKVLDHYDGDLSRTNLHPRTAARYERTYGKVGV